MFKLDTNQACPVERCASINAEGKIMATTPEAPVNFFYINVMGICPAAVANFIISNTQCSVLISNVPGPERGISIWGHPLLDSMFWLPNVGDSGIQTK